MSKKIIIFLIVLFSFSFFVSPALTAKVDDLSETPKSGDYIIGPGKAEIKMDPGQSKTRFIMITNRYGKDMNFKIEIEDFKGSRVPGENVVLLGEQKGPYSLKDFLHPELKNFVLKHGQRMNLPVIISIPADAQPGGLYGSVIVTAVPSVNSSTSNDEVVSGNVVVTSRLASLFFVRVSGEAKEEGLLKDFSTSKKFYTVPEIKFSSVFENNGNVYLNPYGSLEVKNILGTKIDSTIIEPYFAMPDSIRVKDFVIKRSFMFGYYTADLSLNRGYANIVDQKSISFWVLPWKALVVFVLGLMALVSVVLLILKWFNANFERKNK